MTRAPSIGPAEGAETPVPLRNGREHRRENAESATTFLPKDDSSGCQVLDRVMTAYLDTHADIPNRWLLIQTVATAQLRRALLATLRVQPRWRTLDIGTGFGPVPMDLAAMAPVDAVGVDFDERVLRAADAIRVEVAGEGGFHPGSRVSFESGDAYALNQADAGVDLATARFVFQHLHDHAAAASELARVVKPGGFACLIDVDDGLSLTHPEPSAAYLRLADALATLQARRGGGRHLARTLPGRLDRAGFDVLAVFVVPQATYGASRPGDLNRTFLVERFASSRNELIGKVISGDEFDDCLARFAAEITIGQCAVENHLAVVGRRR